MGENKQVVWARRSVVSERCPKSVITAQSIAYLERFRLWKKFGTADLWNLEAKTADALELLDDAYRKELSHGE